MILQSEDTKRKCIDLQNFYEHLYLPNCRSMRVTGFFFLFKGVGLWAAFIVIYKKESVILSAIRYVWLFQLAPFFTFFLWGSQDRDALVTFLPPRSIHLKTTHYDESLTKVDGGQRRHEPVPVAPPSLSLTCAWFSPATCHSITGIFWPITHSWKLTDSKPFAHHDLCVKLIPCYSWSDIVAEAKPGCFAMLGLLGDSPSDRQFNATSCLSLFLTFNLAMSSLSRTSSPLIWLLIRAVKLG